MTSLRELARRATEGPDYPPESADLTDLRIAGLTLPRRASIAILVSTALILADQLRLLMPAVEAAGTDGIGGVRPLTIARFVLFLVVPAAVVVLGFRDGLGRYGLKLGNWRWGLGLLFGGLIVMTPIILALSGEPSFRGYYGSTPTSLGAALLNHLGELIPAEFLVRGFLMFALWRRIGALALVVVQVPFILTHIGKPEIELWSTFVGGAVFAWLDWRTGSILWSALGHVYVLTLMVVAVGGATL